MGTKGDKLKLLDKLVGVWNTEGKVLQTQTGPEIKIRGTDTYQWLPGEYFLQHIVDVLMGDERNQTYEIIGYNESADNFSMHYFDNKGNSGFMKANFINDQWHFMGDNLRFTGSFSNDDNTFSGIWELLENNHWRQFIHITLSKRES